MVTRMILFLACVYLTTAQVIKLNDGDINALVDGHNDVRKAQGATAMQKIRWNPKLQEFAEQVASRCQSHSSNDERSNLAGFDSVGENIYQASGKPGDFKKDVVEYWASESKDYDLEANQCSDTCGHYTQVTWASTSDIGCGMAKCDGSDFPIMLVCSYGPAGNMNNERPFAKGEPGSECSQKYPGTKADQDGLCVSGASRKKRSWRHHM